MKYFSHTSSTFDPKGKYHYSNDAENYKIGVETSQLNCGDMTEKSKLRYIKLYLVPKFKRVLYDEECPTEKIFDYKS